MKPNWLLFLFLPYLAQTQLRLAPIFSDNMVLQRDQPLCIWGKAIPETEVWVSFAGERQKAVAQRDSSWRVYFNRQKASARPQSLTVAGGGETLVLENILVGDVWLCSGQSNMEWPLNREMHWEKEKTNAAQPLIRLYNPPPAGRGVFGVAYTDSLSKRLNTADFYLPSSWQSCDSNTVKNMSAVGYYFARAITFSENIPVGLINLSIGGAPIETFISREALRRDGRFSKKLEGNWLENPHLPVWIRERGKQNVGGNPDSRSDQSGPNHAYKPGFAFESGVRPLLQFPIKGILWYQGESNAQETERVEEYASLSALMVDDYRKQWKLPHLPFYYVQLSSIDTLRYKGHLWPRFRDEQRKIMQHLPHSGMAVSSDIGAQHDVHPRNKKEVGERLARWALYQTYRRAGAPSGPLPLKTDYQKEKLIVRFRYAKHLNTSDGKALRGFSLDGKAEATAFIRENSVIIPCAEKPAFIFYAWKPFTDANLVNEEMLPASTFKIRIR